MFHSGSSMFFIQQSPGRFGGKQEDYLEQVRKVVSETANQIEESVKAKKNLEAVFSEILNNLAKTRSAIAIKHQTKNHELFGAFRGQDGVDTDLMMTPLDNVYSRYNDHLLKTIQTHLKKMRHNKEKFEQTALKVQEKVFGRQTSWDISILPGEKLSEWYPTYSEDTFIALCSRCGIPPMNAGTSVDDYFKTMLEKKNLKLIRERSIEDYKKLKFMWLISDIASAFLVPRTDWVLITVRCEIQGKLYALTQYLTWMCRNITDDPVEYMSTRPDKTYITLIHQDPFLIKDSLTEIAKVFKKAVEWKPEEGLEALTRLIAEITYLFSHAMPLKRGSAAVGEWLEMAIYQYHGFNIKYAEGICVNMEALTLSYKEFIEKYPSFFKIELINTANARPSS